MQLTTKQKHSIAMWISDILGSMIGGVIITIWLSMVIYYGIGLDKVINQARRKARLRLAEGRKAYQTKPARKQVYWNMPVR
jgi:hypothetical protein